MFLKTIKLAGFKSFVDPTTIVVRSNMNAVVGPNGCGKSNVVDAIRWVIGESSAKQLRGQCMSDVIFNGTSARKPVGKAMVELLFDNSDGRLLGEYAKYNEIAIRREVQRDGQSSYFLNGTHCRRRDILDVFLGTGLGPRSYSIIEQGMISQLIESKPEELRAHFEEVAGISKYKERRRETETRIRHTNENLERLNDIREELDKQLRHLKRQANAAERFKVYKQEERLVTAQIKGLHWRQLSSSLKQQEEALEQQGILREQKVADLRHFESELERLRVLQEEATENQGVVQKKYYGLGADIARLEQQIQHAQQQVQNWQEEFQDTQSLWQELSDAVLEHKEQIETTKLEIDTLVPQHEEVVVQVEMAKQALIQAESDMQFWQEKWDSYQQSASQTSSQLQVMKTKLDHHNQQIERLQKRQEHLQEQLAQITVTEEEDAMMAAKESSAILQEQLETTRGSLEAFGDKINSQRSANQQKRQAIHEARRELQSSEGRYSSLDALQQAALGRDDKAVNDWLSQCDLMDHERLGQQLEVAKGYEVAVEAVMRGYFDAVCVEFLDQFIDELPLVSEGAITLVNKHQANAMLSSSKGTLLSEKVSSAWPFQSWLQGVYIAEDLVQAKGLRSQLELHESVITKEGVWLGKNWARVNKKTDPKSGILLREQQLKQLELSIADKQSEISGLEAILQESEALLASLEAERDESQRQYQQISKDFTQAQSQFSAYQTKLENMQRREQELLLAMEESSQQLEQTKMEFAELEQSFIELSEAQAGSDEQRESLLAQRDQYRAQLGEKRNQAQDRQHTANDIQRSLSRNQQQLALLQQSVQRDERQLEQLTERREILSGNLAVGNEPLEELKISLQAQLSDRLSIEEKLHQAEDTLEQCNQQLKNNTVQRQEVSDSLAALQAKIDENRMQRQTLVVRQTTIKEQLAETDFVLEEVIAGLPEEAEIGGWELQVERLSQRIQRLGPINLAAIDEYQTQSERKEYLDNQNDDLVEALDLLQTAIQKIDRESKAKFRETYDQVNKGFQEKFPKIFGGGHATLELTDDDLLTTGITVQAQPPGKRNSSIQMLSGGEKALTAIALVFAIFQLNPAPFCILDEVDAPLDDLNVGRFCNLVKEMSQQTQFLMISHNKVSIEAADQLMGVTMHEPGVSRIVSVDMQEAIEMAGAA